MKRYAITNGTSSPQLGERMAQWGAGLARNGVDFILIREKHLAAGDLAQISRDVLTAVRRAGAQTRVLIGQRVDVARAVNADGVHLSAQPGELTPSQVLQLMPNAFVSVSCHSMEDVERAREERVAAILFGPIFGKTAGAMEVVPGIGLKRLQEACDVAGEIPVFALGGITQENASACLQAGASGIAGIRLFE